MFQSDCGNDGYWPDHKAWQKHYTGSHNAYQYPGQISGLEYPAYKDNYPQLEKSLANGHSYIVKFCHLRAYIEKQQANSKSI